MSKDHMVLVSEVEAPQEDFIIVWEGPTRSTYGQNKVLSDKLFMYKYSKFSLKNKKNSKLDSFILH